MLVCFDIFSHQKAKGGYLEGSLQLPQTSGDLRIVISTMSPGSEGGDAVEQFHPNMIHLVRKEADGKNRVADKETVPNIHHWQLEMELKSEGRSLNLYVRNKTSEKDETREIPEVDFLFSIDPNRILKLGKEKKNLHLTILHPKTDKRSKGDEISLEKIVKVRIKNDKMGGQIQEKFSGKNSKYLKKVQLKCEVFDLESDELLGCCTSDVIKDPQSRDFGSLEMKEVRPRVSCELGGRSVLVVTEHPVKRGSVIPVLQLFDSHGQRLEDEETRVLAQPQVLETDDRMLKFLAPRQELFGSWSRDWVLKLKLRRKDTSEESESISSCDFQYRPHESFTLLDGGGQPVCLYCHSYILDGAQDGLSVVSLPSHCGPGLKRRRISSTVRENNTNTSTPTTLYLQPGRVFIQQKI